MLILKMYSGATNMEVLNKERNESLREEDPRAPQDGEEDLCDMSGEMSSRTARSSTMTVFAANKANEHAKKTPDPLVLTSFEMENVDKSDIKNSKSENENILAWTRKKITCKLKNDDIRTRRCGAGR